jgi:hypothetical protein
MTKNVYCSFCGKSSGEVGRMMETTDQHVPGSVIRICRECAELAIQIIDANQLPEDKP